MKLGVVSSNGTNQHLDTTENANLNPADWLDVLDNVQLGRDGLIEGQTIGQAIMFRAGLLEDDKLFPSIKAAPYHLWPINTGLHWQAIFVHTEQTDASSGVYDRVKYFAITDSLPNTSRFELIETRLVKIYESGGLSCPPRAKSIWVPTQPDEFSCGLITTSFIWEMMRRIHILERYETGDVASLLMPMSPYFNPDHCRVEMAACIAGLGLKRPEIQSPDQRRGH
ncbi:hypothetical protein F5X99DRAFT_407354 [Biscogniauxia marginata]|nr:hypothetical protein F5X99DRAFT_407354 [Biscogniauxia marginata]